MRALTMGVISSAMNNQLGPVQIAQGMTSPKNRTAVTDIIIAHTEGTNASKKIGKASMAKAFESSKVTSNR